MAETPPVDAVPEPAPSLNYDGTNHDQVLDFLRDQGGHLNPLLRGGVVLDPAPGEVAYIEVEYADGSSLKLTAGDTVTADPEVAIGVQGGAVTAPLPPTA